MRFWTTCVVLCPLALFAQGTGDDIRRATLTGAAGSSSGKCTLEVRVDHQAEVDVYGDSARLRTLAGQPATWVRMQCTDALPLAMSDFRFRGIDGRGSVTLLQDPRNNNGMAVIRVEDPGPGAERFTFDLEWSGARQPGPRGAFETPVAVAPSRDNGRSAGRAAAGRAARGVPAVRMIESCWNEVSARAGRDHNLANIDLTSVTIENAPGRQETLVGTFDEGSGQSRVGAQYRFSCSVDGRTGRVRSVDLLASDGSPLRPGATAGTTSNVLSPPAGFGVNQDQAFRACQDAVIARAAQSGYQNARFQSTSFDNRRSEWIVGTMTAARGPITDTFEFGCAMDLRAAQVRNVDLARR
jgi:hypothetical protein